METKTFKTFKVVVWHPDHIFIHRPKDCDIILDGKQGTQRDKYDGTFRVRQLSRHYAPDYLAASTLAEKTEVAMMMTKQLLHERRSFSALVPFRDEPNTSIFEPLPSHENTTKIISKIKV